VWGGGDRNGRSNDSKTLGPVNKEKDNLGAKRVGEENGQ